MLQWLLSKTIGTKNERDIKKLKPLVALINSTEQAYQSLNESQLIEKTLEFKDRVKQGETLDGLMVEAFALIKNVCRRLCGTTWDVCGHSTPWNMIPYDVQIMGAISLHQGKIVEMATGEGKTLVATMPLYLNALSGKGVHIITVNDYLALRDSQWMGRIFEFLGLTVGCLQNQMPTEQRRKAYACDITYGTNSEFGFDYLRDNSTASSKEDQVQRGHFYAIVDEVDSILIDEARTPLIISGPVSVSTHRYDKLKAKVAELFKKQTMLCNRLLKEVKEAIDSSGNSLDEEAGIKLLLIQKGTPKNKQLLKLLEDPAIRKLEEKTELAFLSDMRKGDYQALKEELFFLIEEKNNVIELTDKGRSSISQEPDEFIIPDIISLYQEIDSDESIPAAEKETKKLSLQKKFEETSEKIHNLNQLLKAYSLFEKDVDYVVQDNKVLIVDEFTGRIMQGRRFSDGLHQALEAKEDVTIEEETQTFASITIQNYFRMYEKLSGMTGTAETEAQEFHQIYKLDVLVVPTNAPVIRDDLNDKIYKTKREKYNAIISHIEQLHGQGTPVLVGTITVDTSEVLSRLLKRRGIPHAVLNAKYHQQEAEIIAQAGKKHAVTIATNMAGRGTDIKLGEGVVGLGGLYVIGTERHESRRIDRQLRGRCGRQGDPGASLFYISLEDDLMRLFGSERIANIMGKIGMEENQELTHPLLTKAIEKAQKRVEERNFSIRKHTLEYDNVMNKQRQIIYEYRQQFLESSTLKEFILETTAEVIESKLSEFSENQKTVSDEAQTGFLAWFNDTFPFARTQQLKDANDILPSCLEKIKIFYGLKEKYEGEQGVRMLERYVCLSTVDRLWKEHLYNMDQLRESVYLRAYGQVDPLLVYKKEGFAMFAEMMDNIKREISTGVFKHAIVTDKNAFQSIPQEYKHAVISGFNVENENRMKKQEAFTNQEENGAEPKGVTFKRSEKKVGRNDLCPCGSGKKYKKCCGA